MGDQTYFSEIEKHGLNENIIDIIPGGVAAIRVADKKMLFISDRLLSMIGYSREDYESSKNEEWFAKLIYPADMALVQEQAYAQLRKNGRIELEYRLAKKNGEPLWIRLYSGLMKNEQWGLYLQCIFVDNSESRRVMEEIRDTRAEMDALINTIPGGVAQVVLDDDFRIILASAGFYRLTGYTREEYHAEPINGKGINLVLKEDVPMLAASVKEQVVAGKSLYVEYRIRKKNGEIGWITAYASTVSSGSDGMIVEGVFIDSTSAKETEHRLVTLMNNIPGGIAHVHLDDKELIIDYASDGFYRMMGYDAEEYFSADIQARYLKIIHPEDRQKVFAKAITFVNSHKTCSSLDYRIVTKSGVVRWNRVNATRIIDVNEAVSLECIITDITDSKDMETQLAVAEERYRIISEQAQEIIFDWDMKTGSVYHSPVFEKKFGYTIPTENSIEFIKNSETIHPDDVQNFTRMVTSLSAGDPYAEQEYRIAKIDGSYVWCKIRATNIFDKSGKPTRAIGIISDIDSYKRENALLQEMAQEDQLTGMLNKMTTQRRVEERLAQSKANQRHAFYIIDIDNFKKINDTLGHLTGDLVLTEVSDRIRRQFRGNDVVGRIGGDEFAIFVENVPGDEVIMEKARVLSKVFRHSLKGAKEDFRVSGSIGIAIYPDHGTTFDELYAKADAALYRSKQKGKDCVSVYHAVTT